MLAKPAVEAVENGDIQFVPKQYENMYFSRMRDIRDWCISRQLWVGVTIIPAWYDSIGSVTLAVPNSASGGENNLGADVRLRQDEDVLDTVLLRTVDFLHPRLAGKHRRAASVPPPA